MVLAIQGLMAKQSRDWQLNTTAFPGFLQLRETGMLKVRRRPVEDKREHVTKTGLILYLPIHNVTSGGHHHSLLCQGHLAARQYVNL